MPYPWLMRFHLSAAIALPSVTLLWMTAPAGAFDGSYVPESSDTTSLSSQAVQKGHEATAEASSITSQPATEAATIQYTATSSSTSKSTHRHQSGYALIAPVDGSAGLSSTTSQAWGQDPSSQVEPETVSSTESWAAAPEAATATENTDAETTAATTALPTVEAPQFEVLFSEELPAPPPQTVSETALLEATATIDGESVDEDIDVIAVDPFVETGDSTELSNSTGNSATGAADDMPAAIDASEETASEETINAIEIEVINAPDNLSAVDPVTVNTVPVTDDIADNAPIDSEMVVSQTAEAETAESGSEDLSATQIDSEASNEGTADIVDIENSENSVTAENIATENTVENLSSDTSEEGHTETLSEGSDSPNVAQASEENAESSDGEDVFVPLPESDEDSETDVDLEEFSQPDEAVSEHMAGESVPIPADRVLDALPYLDPDPNPLLIQTQPEEVEIIGLQPITLEEAVELSYRNNPDLQIALLELEQSRAGLREAQADNFPTVTVSGNLQGQNATVTGSSELVPNAAGGFDFESSTNEEFQVSGSAQVDVVYNIFSSGLRESSIRAAEEQVELSELEVERRQEELRLVTANEYYDLQAAIESIRISQAFLEEAERNLADTSLREEVGIGTRFDVLRAEVQAANARQDLVNAERARQVAQRTLARRLNIPPSLNITTSPVSIAGTWSLDLEESIVLAYQNRAELEQQLVQREISEELRQAELAALGPQVDLFANYTLSNNFSVDDSFDDNYSLGARVSWTLFDGGAARARSQQREIDSEIAERNFEESRNTVRLSVESAYYNLEANLENISTAQLAVEQAAEARNLAILRFDAGVGTQLDILTAQSELTDAEVNLVDAIVGYNRSLAELERAVSNIPESFYDDLPF